MDNDNRSLVDRLDATENKIDSVNEKVDELLKAINEFNKQNQCSSQNIKSQKQIEKKTVLNDFIRKSKKEYIWFGPNNEFSKAKTLLCMNMLALIVVGVLSTIFSSIAIGFYSPFTLVENIWLIFTIVMATYSFNFKKKMSDVDLKNHSCENFSQDRDGTWRISSNKKSFIWFRRLSDISCIANIIMMCCLNQGGMSIVGTIFEVLMFGLTICTILSYSNLTCMYGNFIFYTYKNNSNQTITLVFDIMGRKLITYEEFDKKYGKTLI